MTEQTINIVPQDGVGGGLDTPKTAPKQLF